MRKLSLEVNDSEICKRLETLMLTSKEDLPLSGIKSLLENPLEYEPKEIPEPFTQYVRHFIYMVKRNERQGFPYNYSNHDLNTEKSSKSLHPSPKPSEAQPTKDEAKQSSQSRSRVLEKSLKMKSLSRKSKSKKKKI